MTKWLLKIFLRGGELSPDPACRTRAATLGTCVGIVVNIVLAAVKFTLGVISGSVAVTADAINNLSDMAGSLMALLTVRLAQKPVDREHPFGHGRLEYVGALGIGALIVMMAFELFKSSVDSILHPEIPAFSWWLLALLLLSVGAKVWLFFFYRYVGRKISSSALEATAKDSLSDSLATSAVAISMLIGHFAGLKVDGWMGLLVALLVLKAGYEVCRDTIGSLLGGKPDPELGRQIIDMLMRYDGILGTHDLMLHDYGPGRCVASVHAEVPADYSIIAAHEIIDRAEQEISRELNIPICIHMDPVVTDDEDANKAKAALMAFLQEQGKEFMLHDLRRVPGEKRINLIFDVVIPADFRDQEQLTHRLEEQARKLDERYHCIVHYDIDYYHP